MKKSIPKIREREGNEKKAFPKFGNTRGMTKSIPIIREQESEAFILGNGWEREFPLTPGKALPSNDMGHMGSAQKLLLQILSFWTKSWSIHVQNRGLGVELFIIMEARQFVWKRATDNFEHNRRLNYLLETVNYYIAKSAAANSPSRSRLMRLWSWHWPKIISQSINFILATVQFFYPREEHDRIKHYICHKYAEYSQNILSWSISIISCF